MCEVSSLCVDVSSSRRGGLQDRDYLLFLYSAALYAAQDTLMKRNYLQHHFPSLLPLYPLAMLLYIYCSIYVTNYRIEVRRYFQL